MDEQSADRPLKITTALMVLFILGALAETVRLALLPGEMPDPSLLWMALYCTGLFCGIALLCLMASRGTR